MTIEEKAIEYAKSVSKNESYQEYLKKAFLAGWKARQDKLENDYNNIHKFSDKGLCQHPPLNSGIGLSARNFFQS